MVCKGFLLSITSLIGHFWALLLGAMFRHQNLAGMLLSFYHIPATNTIFIDSDTGKDGMSSTFQLQNRFSFVLRAVISSNIYIRLSLTHIGTLPRLLSVSVVEWNVTSTRALAWGSGGGPFGTSTDGSSGWWDGSGGSSSSSSDSNGNGNVQGNSIAGFSLSDAAFRSPGFDVAQAVRLRGIHGILASVALVALFPLGAILMRCVPGRSAWAVHAATQLLGYAVYAAAAGMGLYLVSEVRIPTSPTGTTRSLLSDPRTNAHPIIGVVVLAALTLQPALGWLHHRRFARLRRRTAASHAHLWLGRAAVTLGIVNGGLGLGLARARASDPAAVVAYAVVALAMWALWVAAAAVAAVRRRRTAGGWRKVEKSDAHAPAPAPEETTRGRGRCCGGPAQQQQQQHVPPPQAVVAEEEDMPSPPYTPGPLYEGQAVHDSHHEHGRGQAIGLRPMKSSVDRSDTTSSMSSYGTHRGQV
ncbi:hypothetical protein F4809DRAFT_666314 [Biscogniauxia mediterranea]|nr:hypothetical protein F4809DRAFT_666314 [Biscogniauxia mediterranea]